MHFSKTKPTMSQQGQFPINPNMVPQQNQIPLHHPIHMQQQQQQQMHMSMSMPMHHPNMVMQQMHMPYHMPLQVPYSTHDAGYPSSMKRRRDDEDLGIASSVELSAAKRAKGQDVIFRIVVPSKQIGKVIGKEGCRIQKIREETRANIKIADAIAVSSLYIFFLWNLAERKI